MSDPLENFIRKNRHEFDDVEPSKNVWEKIYQQQHSGGPNWLWKAAAVLFFLTSSFLLYQQEFKDDSNLLASDTEQLDDEFRSVESFYFKKISEKKEMIYNFEESHLIIDRNVEHDLQKLDAMYAVLKDELKNNPSKKVVDALILNLLVRVDILNKTLEELEDTSSKKVKESNV